MQGEVTNMMATFFSNQKETGLCQAERYFLICMKRIAELSGKLGYLEIMSKSEKDNKSGRVRATLSRSDCSLGRIRTIWILMRQVLVECKSHAGNLKHLWILTSLVTERYKSRQPFLATPLIRHEKEIRQYHILGDLYYLSVLFNYSCTFSGWRGELSLAP